MSGLELILASSSPRRRELLERAGLAYRQVSPCAASEDAKAASWRGLPPERLASRLALLKALAVARREPLPRAAVVIGADTVVAFEGRCLGKPKGRTEALEALRSLAGRRHRVLTGLALIFLDDGELVVDTVSTVVELAAAQESLLFDYVDAGLCYGKAGSYGIQDPLFEPMVRAVEGSLDNVVGLPVRRLEKLLERSG
jgi:septum formation protein